MRSSAARRRGQRGVAVGTGAAVGAVAGLLGGCGQVKALLFGKVLYGVVQQPLGPQGIALLGKVGAPVQQVLGPVQIGAARPLRHDAAAALHVAVAGRGQAGNGFALCQQVGQQELILIPFARGIAQVLEQAAAVELIPRHNVVDPRFRQGKAALPDAVLVEDLIRKAAEIRLRQRAVLFIDVGQVEDDQIGVLLPLGVHRAADGVGF